MPVYLLACSYERYANALVDALDPVWVVDLAGDVGTAVLVHRPGQGVHVGRHLGDVGGSLGARFDVDGQDMIASGDDEIGLAGEGGGTPLEPEGVLGFDVEGVSAVLEFAPGVGQQGGMVDLPAGGVEFWGLLGPALVMGLEPDGSLAVFLAGEEFGKPGGRDVGQSSRPGS